MRPALRALPAVAYMALLFALSSQPLVMPPGPPGNDKLIHVAAYFVLAALCWIGLPVSASPRRAVLAAAIATVYGATDEVHQLYVPGRFGDLGDFAADAVGSALGATAAWTWARRR